MTNPVCTRHAVWHVVQTKARQEFRALEQLQNQRYVCFLPTIQVEKIIHGKLETRIEPMFSRYLFIRLDATNCNWSPIRSTRGVSNLVSFGGRFATLPDVCVEAIERMPQATSERLFAHGDRVAITHGPFAGLEGIYQLPDGEARALVLIDLMNQPQKLKFAIDALRKAA